MRRWPCEMASYAEFNLGIEEARCRQSFTVHEFVVQLRAANEEEPIFLLMRACHTAQQAISSHLPLVT